MTCRHQPGDPSCSSHPDNVERQRYEYEARQAAERRTKEELQREIVVLRAQISVTPDANNYQVDDVEQVGSYIVIKARYPNCAKCAYEGVKVMVFKGVNLKDVVKWRKIDPHFRPTLKGASVTEAPSPVARFPGNAEGWQDAMDYAANKQKGL